MRACDCCRRRKIKCDGFHPCQKCQSVSLECTYDAHPQRKGPKRQRDAVIEELRTSKKTKDGSSTSPDGGRGHKESMPPSWSGFSKQVLRRLVSEYFRHLHIVTPVLNCQNVLKYLDKDQPTWCEYCLITGIAAYVLFVKPPPGMKNEQLADELFVEAGRARENGHFIDEVSVDTVMAVFFLFACNFRTEKFAMSWYLLRESITMAQILGVHSESHYEGLDEETELEHRILFYTLYITERGVYLLAKYPLTLRKTIAFPHLDSDKNDTYAGLVQLATLFTVVDDYEKLLRNGKRYFDVESHARSVLDRLDATEKLTFHMQSDIQKADFFISYQWLKLLVWKTCRYFQSPHIQARILVDMAEHIDNLRRTLSKESLEIHGLGMAMKLSEILKAIVEIQRLNIVPVHLLDNSSIDRVGDRISQILDLIGMFRDYEQVMYFKSLDTLTTSIDLAAFDSMNSLFDIFQQDEEEEESSGLKLLDG